jgi:hypothetical protein
LPREQWKRVQEKLKADPENDEDLFWAYSLLRDYGREDQAREMVAKVFVPRFMKDAGGTWYTFEVSRELERMFKEGGLAAVMPVIQAVEGQLAWMPEKPAAGKAWTKADADSQGRRERLKRLFSKEGDMVWLLELPEGVRKFEAAPKPEVVEVLRDGEGRVVVRVKVPAALVKGLTQQQGWRPSIPGGSGRNGVFNWDAAEETYSFRLETGKDVVVHFEVPISSRSVYGDHPGVMGWDLRVDMAKAKETASVKAWWEQKYPQRGGDPMYGLNQKQKEAVELYAAVTGAYGRKEYAEAVRLGRGLAALSKDLWVRGISPSFFDIQEQNAWSAWWKARVELGDGGEVFKEVEERQAQLPKPMGQAGSADLGVFQGTWWQWGELLEVKAEVVRKLMKEGKLAEARVVMDEILKGRPELEGMPMTAVEVAGPHWRATFVPREFVRLKWAKAGAVEWDLGDAMEEKK